VPAKKATKKATKKAAPRRSTPVVSQPDMTPVRRPPDAAGPHPDGEGGASRPLMPARPGDFIVIDSAQVGSLTREGEVLEVIQGAVSVSCRVKWADGHQSLIAPTGGSARIVPASKRA
jgi:hypothetical protein